jgi:hypothetical protein
VPLRDAGGVPAEFRDLWKTAASGGKAGRHGDYTYQYAAAGDRAAAVMPPRPFPRDDTILVATISDLARRVFRADLSSATPRLEPTRHGNVIAFTVSPYTYYVLTIKKRNARRRIRAGRADRCRSVHLGSKCLRTPNGSRLEVRKKSMIFDRTTSHARGRLAIRQTPLASPRIGVSNMGRFNPAPVLNRSHNFCFCWRSAPALVISRARLHDFC